MPQRVSHSLLDPWLTVPLKSQYRRLPIPPALPPEAIVGLGHLSAIIGACGFALSTSRWYGGVVAALGVIANHTADVLDGTHARATGQCRNGGELLDHFVDPLSFSYWVAGLAYSAGEPWLAVAGITVLYATAVLTSIRAKMLGEFTLARFGPTEFKTLLVAFGASQAARLATGGDATEIAATAGWFTAALTLAGLVQLLASLRRSVHEVNARGAAPADVSEWVVK